jgi:hypothetical protein
MTFKYGENEKTSIKFTKSWITVYFRTKGYIHLSENENKIIWTVITDKTKMRTNIFNIDR